MKVQLGDTVVFTSGRRTAVGIVERRSGRTLSVRIPEEGNQIERVTRDEVEPLALRFRKAIEGDTPRRPVAGVSIAGRGTLAELVTAFGYTADQRMNSSSLDKVMRQLERAGLELDTDTGEFNRDNVFGLALKRAVIDPEPEDEPAEGQLVSVGLPESFWPRALGLSAAREMAFLRALAGREPLLCILYLPKGTEQHAWLQSTWEGMLTWAFHGAQRFVRVAGDFPALSVVRGPAALLHAYLKPTALSSETPRLDDTPHSLNLVVLKQEAESPVDFQRLQATWPGPVFEFGGADAETSGSSIAQLLLLVGGRPDRAVAQVDGTLSPLKLLLWSREASAQVMAQAAAQVGEVLGSGEFPRLRGSNEGAMALALKTHLAHWVKRSNSRATLQFEQRQVEDSDEEGRGARSTRVDLVVDERNLYEVETLVGSGPMESFYHQKVFSRLKDGTLFHLVVPAETLLWAAPFLADIAFHLGSRGRVLVPAAGGQYAQLVPRALSASDAEVRPPESAARIDVRLERSEKPTERPLTLDDIAGYVSVRRAIDQKIVWVEKHHHLTRGLSRTTGILFFGPPGCGKSRLARAIAGTLDHEVRLLSPADLRGPYIGWGQVMIREQFDWAAERERRMLVIDELDAVARSRRSREMHSDEKADVNELLVQLDRVGRLGRLVVGTTNFISSLDEAVVRSGRFGLYIPVGPPDLEEAVNILRYYLARLTPADSGPVALATPGDEELRKALAPLYGENARAGQHFCGADLEAAVNDAFLRSLQAASSDAGSGRHFSVVLPVEEIAASLAAGPRSVSPRSLQRFLKEARRYCGEAVATDLTRRFTAEEASSPKAG